MSFIQMRTVPGLFIGRREVRVAAPCGEGVEAGYRCGDCDDFIHPVCDPAGLRDVVVKCGCGAVNQL